MRCFLAVGLAVVATGCDTAAPLIAELVPFRTLPGSDGIFESYLHSEGSSEEVPATAVVLRGEVEEAAFLATYPRKPFWTDGGGPFHAPFPNVDYSAATAVVVALGTTGSGSVSVRLDSVVARGLRAVAYTTTVIPCRGSRDFVNPSLVAAVDGPNREIVFAPRHEEREACS